MERTEVAGNGRSVTGCSDSGTFAVTRSGDLFVARLNAQGQVGLGDTKKGTTWTKATTEGLRGKALSVKAVSGNCSLNISAIALTSSNDLFVAGETARERRGKGTLGIIGCG
jgi:hypothetical protein